MKKTYLLAALVLFAISITSFTMAYAQESPGIDAGLELGVGLVASGGLSGALLSIMRVAGKALKQKPEGMDSGQFVTNVIIGTVIGLVLSGAGMSAEQLQGNEQVITLAVISSNFMFVYFVNETIRPMFNTWFKNWGAAKAAAKKD